MLRRVYVEKKRDIFAEKLKSDLNENLFRGEKVTDLRILNVYDVEELDDNEYNACKYTVFAEPPVDVLYEDDYPRKDGDFVFSAAFLPGQFDQCADSLIQCVQAVTQRTVLAQTSKTYVISGELSEDEFSRIKKYCVNPVDSEEIPEGKPTAIKEINTEITPMRDFSGFMAKSNEEIRALRAELGLAMSDEDLLFCQDYFKNTERRDPTETEIKVIDTYWSDHCRHTTFLTELTEIEFCDGKYKKLFEDTFDEYLKIHDPQKKITLMDIATAGVRALKRAGKLHNLDESEEINACSIVIDVDTAGRTEKWLLLFKNETHNHPTEIEPFGGAATCLGGAIRDPLSGRAYVYQAMRITGSGDPTAPVSETLRGKLPQRKISKTAAAGFSSYGNQIGLATGYVKEVYHEGYKAKRMELGAVIGAVKKENVRRERPEDSDLIILTGGATGRDGIGGATGSSKEHSDKSLLACGAEVQKGNPPTQRKLQRLFRDKDAAALIKRCNDFGAGGVAVAIGELADGLVIDLESVPKKYDGLNGTELAISESQERMAVVVSAKDAKRFIELAQRENLGAVVVARVTKEPRLVMKWRDSEIVNLSREFLNTNGVTQKTKVRVECNPIGTGKGNYLQTCSQKGLVEMFDSTIGAGTALMPFGGKTMRTPVQAMAAKIPTDSDTRTVSIMAHGFRPYLSEKSPFHGAVCAVTDSAAKLVAAGGSIDSAYLTLQEYFERMHSPDTWGKPFSALLGAFYAQTALGVASIGGKDSMSGTFNDISVPPTVVSFAVDTADVDRVVSPEFKGAGHFVTLVEAGNDENDLPDLKEFLKNCRLIEGLNKHILSAYVVEEGGVFDALAKMSFGNNIGAKITYGGDLYAEKTGAFILETDIEIENHAALGTTIDTPALHINGETFEISELAEKWEKPLESVFHTKTKGDGAKENAAESARKTPHIYTGAKFAAPRVFIPVFPGTNCEIDMKKQFELSGAIVDTYIVKNLSLEDFLESIKEAAARAAKAQIIAFPGGFSFGDEPNGSGKFIAAFFRNPLLAEAVSDLLENRDGLILGICNGFQALVKLGLLPHGKITELSQDDLTLTYNNIGRHISRFAATRIVNNHSPWLSNTKVGEDYHIPLSHGEGRFLANERTFERLAQNGQIATQYVDTEGFVTNDIEYNPNGSSHGIEGITSPDGRIFGKMGHSERIGYGLYKNIHGETDQQIFSAGVKYFNL
ncbi:phosphoribosylformylglycinamidine synthase [Clostridia bacterium]|nr:phosphoribosylformylglycinamidine synthase [Clostridia bacterium]